MLPLLLSYGTVQNGSEGTYYVIFSVFSLDISNINKWLDYFNQLTKERLNIYLLCTLIFYISFLLGDYLCENTRKINIKYIYAKSNKYLYIFLIIFTLFAFLHIYPLLDKLFTGYLVARKYHETGPYTTSVVSLLSIALLYVVKLDQGKLSLYNYTRLIINPAFVIFTIMCILLASLGTRSVMIASILIYLSLYSCYYKKLQPIGTAIILSIILFISHFIMMFRTGAKFWNYSNYSIDRILTYLVSDPLNISYSLLDYLSKYEIHYINIPYRLLSHIIGIIPSFIFPQKNKYYFEYWELGYNFIIWQGTTSTFVSLLINFGIIGTAIFLICVSYTMCWMRKQNGQPYITMYVMSCGWLGFQFFRVFETTMVKHIYQSSLLMPIIVVFFINKLFIWLK